MSIETKHTDSKQWILCAPVIQYVAMNKLSRVKHVFFLSVTKRGCKESLCSCVFKLYCITTQLNTPISNVT